MGRPAQDTDFLRGFGNRMQARCDQLGVSSADLARLTGFHTSHVSLIRNGKTNTTVQALKIICDALDVSADHLLGRSGKHASQSPDPQEQAGALMQAHRVAGVLRETAELLEDMVGARVRMIEAADEVMAMVDEVDAPVQANDDNVLYDTIHGGEFRNIEQLAESLEWDRSRTRKALQRLTSTGRVRWEKRDAVAQQKPGQKSPRWVSRGQYVAQE